MENKFPKNVRQIGNVSDTPKIYVEDYVDTFLNQICDKADKEQAGAFLVGKKEVTEGQECLYIFGAICMEFSSDENLKDLLIICRRNPIDVNRGSEVADKYRYGEHLPRSSVYDFLREIENKFGYNFIVDETTKNVNIRRLNLSLEKEVKVLDGVAKHFLSDEDRVTGII